MPKSKLAKLKNELEAAEKDVRFKEAQLSELKEQVSRARLRVEELEGEVQSNVALEDDVQALLYHQQQTAAAFKDYENRVLALELQGLVERWRAMDVEELAQQNHELREECMRLHQENMELSRSVAEGSLHARRDLARIELALEMTVKEKMQEMHAKLRKELYDEMDDKTKVMVHNHGALQDHMQLLAGQAATLDRQYRALQADRARYKVDADVAASLGEQQAAQTVELRRQLKQSYQAIEVLRRKLAESEARAEAAWDEAMRAGSRAAAASARAAAASAAASGGQHGAGAGGTGLEGDGDSAYGMAGGEGAEMAALEAQLRHGRQRFERMRLQRDRWRERSLLYERACAQLQAALQTLQDQARLSLPGGVKQDLDAIWCAAKASPDPETGQVSTPVAGGAGALSPLPAASRPATARSGHSGASPRVGGGSGEWGPGGQGGGGKGWAAGGGAGAARMRASSARPAGAAGPAALGPGHVHGSGAGVSLGGLPARPQTAIDPTTAARRAAEQIRRSVNAPPGSRPASAFPGHAAGGSGHGHGVGGRGGGAGGEAQCEELVYEDEQELEEDDEPVEPPGATAAAAAAAAAGMSGSASSGAGWGGDAAVEGRSTSPPGRVPVSRMYSEAAEPFKTAWQPGYQPVSDLRPLSPPARGPPSFGTGGASTSLGLGLSASGFGAGSAAGPLSSMELPPARTPGSVRPHSALPAARLEPQAGQAQPRWTPGKSLTGLTSSPPPAAGAAAPGPEPSLQGSVPQPHEASSTSGAHSPTPSPPRMRPPLGSAGEAAEAEWQAWQGQRQRAQSPQYAEIARNTSGNLPLSVVLAASNAASNGLAAPAVVGATSTGPEAPTATRQTQELPLASLGPGLVPPVSVGGGAIYTVAHAASKIPTPGYSDASATSGGPGAGALTSSGLLPPSAAAAVSASQAAAAQYLQTYGSGAATASASAAAATGTSSRGAPAGTPGGPGAALTNPSTMLNALRRPPSAAKKLSSADVMFAGSRPNSARSQSGSAAASARGPLSSSRGNSLGGLGGSGSAR